MSGGIRAELRIPAPGSCPVVRAATTAGAPATDVVKSVAPDPSQVVTEEFTLPADAAAPGATAAPIFEGATETVYRLSRERHLACPCEVVEAFDAPVRDVAAADGALDLAFIAPDRERLAAVLDRLRTRYPTTQIRHLRSDDGGDLVLIDRGRLTDRQREVLTTAHELGYFDHPKGANAGEVATELGIATATFTEHLAAAQSKLLESLTER